MILCLSVGAISCNAQESPRADETSSAAPSSPSPPPSDASPSPTSDKPKVHVYVQGAFSGPYAPLAEPVFNGAALRFEELAKSPTFPVEVKLLKANTAGDPERGRPAAKKVARDPKAVAVIGPVFSGESMTAGPIYERARIPFITPSASNPDLDKMGWNYWYRLVIQYTDQELPIATFMHDYLHARRVLLVHDGSDYGRPLTRIVGKLSKDIGMTPVGEVGGQTGDRISASKIQQAAKRTNPDVVFFGGYEADFAQVIRALRTVDINVPVVSGDGSATPLLPDLLYEHWRDVYVSSPSTLSSEFVELYLRRFGSDDALDDLLADEAPFSAPEAYDAASVLGQAIEEAFDQGLRKPKQIRKVVQNYLLRMVRSRLEFTGIAGPYSFVPHTHDLAVPYWKAWDFYEVSVDGARRLGTLSDLE